MAIDLTRGRAIIIYRRSLMALTIAESLGRRGVEVIGADDVGLTALSFANASSSPQIQSSPRSSARATSA